MSWFRGGFFLVHKLHKNSLWYYMQQQYAVDVRINKPFNSLRHFEPILSAEYHLEKKNIEKKIRIISYQTTSAWILNCKIENWSVVCNLNGKNKNSGDGVYKTPALIKRQSVPIISIDPIITPLPMLYQCPFFKMTKKPIWKK